MDLVIYGAGGFGKEIACLINHQMSDDFRNKYNFIGFIDDSQIVGKAVFVWMHLDGGIPKFNRNGVIE